MWSLAAGTPLADRYLLIERLGAGGMSVVWRGVDTVLARPVAVKVLAGPLAADPAFRTVIEREARAAARLTHPHLTHVYDYGEATLPDGHLVPYVVMELLTGRPLAERLAEGPLPWPEAVRLCAQIADGLAAAHRRGIVHRDIAPANVMLTGTGAKLLDFGIATPAGTRAEADDGSLLGTPAYVAPERLDDPPAAPAVDVYGLGALLYETLAGRPPLIAGTWAALAQAHRRGVRIAPLVVEGLPATVDQLCRRCLDPDPAARPGSAEVARLLRAALPATHTEVLFTPIGTPGQAPRRRRAHRIRRTVLVALAAVVVAGALATVTVLEPRLATPLGAPRTPLVSSEPPAAGGTPSALASAEAPSPAPTPSGAVTGDLRMTVIQDLLDEVEAGRSAGAIRPDVATDLGNVLHNLQRQLTDGTPVDVAAQVALIRTKISNRLDEGGIDYPYASQLLSTVDDLVSP
jgi:serine/threonine-protein kinase